MNSLRKATFAMCVVLFTAFVMSFILLGCSSPSASNSNNINVNVGEHPKEQSTETSYTKEITRNCSPRSKCPHLWRWVDSVNKRKMD